MRLDIIILAIGILLVSLVRNVNASVPEPQIAKADHLVGAYYFPGWNQAEKWYCMVANRKVQHPLLGYYREGEPEVADWHIKWALEHGVSFFAFDFYTAGGSQMLETALDGGFLKSKYIDSFRFCLNWCNHAAVSTMTERELEDFGDLVIGKYLTHPSYLKIEGKPVVMFLVGNGFVRNLGVEKAKAAFERFEERCIEKGLPGVYLVFCEGEIHGTDDILHAKAAGADAFCLYNYPYSGTGLTGPGKHAEFSYEHLISEGEKLWKHWRQITSGDFWPTVMPGWDRRPWTRDTDVLITGSTPELFGKSLTKAREFVNKDKVVMIEAWNEWAEGSVLEPSVEHGFAYLDQVRRIFCQDAKPHRDARFDSAAMRVPVFDAKLPCTDVWTFDFDTNGWTAANFADFREDWGAIRAKSTSNDPNLTSPVTYLACKDYGQVKIRMRASTPEGGTATAQLFWSSVERTMCEETSLKFPISLDGAWHDYTLNLLESPAWTGTTDRLRFDPVDKAGVEVEIDEIRFSCFRP